MVALADATAPLGMIVPLCDVREAALVRGEDVRWRGHAGRTGRRVCAATATWPEAPPSAEPPEGPSRNPTWPTCGGRRSGAGPSRSPPPDATTSS